MTLASTIFKKSTFKSTSTLEHHLYTSPMIHTKYQGIRPSGSEEEYFKSFFYHILAWRPSWSCDQNKLYSFGYLIIRGFI